MADSAKRAIYERLPDETPTAFQAFQHYRDSPPNDRSIVKTYRAVTGIEDAKKPSGRYSQWSKKHRWLERAKAYDDHLDKIQTGTAEGLQARKITEYRERAEKLAKAANETTIRLLVIANHRLLKIEEKLKADPNAKIDIPDKQLPSMLRAIAAISDTAMNAEAEAIGVADLLDRFEREGAI